MMEKCKTCFCELCDDVCTLHLNRNDLDEEVKDLIEMIGTMTDALFDLHQRLAAIQKYMKK